MGRPGILAKEKPKFKPSRRRMFECEECGELFVDEESLENHMASHSPEQKKSEPKKEPEASAEPKKKPRPSFSRKKLDKEEAAEPPEEAPPPPKKKFESPLKRRLLRNRGEAEEEAPETTPRAEEALPEEDPPEEDAGPPLPPVPKGPSFGERFSQLVAEFGLFLRGLVSSGQRATSDFTRESVLPAGAAFLRMVIALMVVVGVLLIGIGIGRLVSPVVRGGTADRTPSLLPPPPETTPGMEPRHTASTPQQVVQDFYRALDESAYPRAYSHLSTAWKRELPFAQFERGYASTQSVSCAVIGAREVSTSQVKVQISLEVTENGRLRRHEGTHVVSLTPDGWKIDGGALGP